MASDIDIAAQHTNGGAGAIVELYVSPNANVMDMGGGFYRANIPNPIQGKYYRLNGITPKRVLDYTGKVQLYP